MESKLLKVLKCIAWKNLLDDFVRLLLEKILCSNQSTPRTHKEHCYVLSGERGIVEEELDFWESFFKSYFDFLLIVFEVLRKQEADLLDVSCISSLLKKLLHS